jgi:hypothetical protein
MQTVYSDHNRLDERSLTMHRLIAAKVQADPALLDKAREHLRRWQEMEGSPKLALTEWERIVSGPKSGGATPPNARPAVASPAGSPAF